MVNVRTARADDREAIRHILKLAFDRPGKNQAFNEWEVAVQIPNDPGFIEELSLVAETKEGIQGYVLLTRAQIGEDTGLTLGPLAVRPNRQRQGIGTTLVKTVLRRAEALGFPWVVLTGGPYYDRFFFEPASGCGIILGKDHPENPYLKIRFLTSCPPLKGTLRYCRSFYGEDGQLL